MFTLINFSGYSDADLKRFFAAGFRATRKKSRPRRRIVIKVVAAPARSRGCADVGGHRMTIAIAAPSHADYKSFLRRLARLFEHEDAHLQGVDHSDMEHDLLYSIGPIPKWATAFLPKAKRIRYLGRAPKQLPILRMAGLTRS